MILYRGSNKKIEKPKINPKSGIMSLGAGFYLTTDKRLAERDAQEMSKRLKYGRPTVNEYEISNADMKALETVKLSNPDQEWISYMISMRAGEKESRQCDVLFSLDADFFTYALPTMNPKISRALLEKLLITGLTNSDGIAG